MAGHSLDLAGISDTYRIQQELGRGGMAIVFLAEDLKHGRDVAIKVLRPELSSVLGADRFLQEIRVMATLQHPNILPLYDSGHCDGLLYYVMPPVEGGSLRERIQHEKQLPIDEAIEIGARVADALQYAHDRDVLHRDMKPENILMHRGVPMVSDFGIALAMDRAGADRLTETGLAIGTPEYMSPEQAGGERDVDSRSDTYALACVVFEMLTGEPPFTGPTTQAIISKTFANPIPLAGTVRDTVPHAMDEALTRALAKIPADRFKNIADFSAALGEAAGVGIVTSPRPSAAQTKKSIAVLPFANMSPDPGDDYLSDGISEELIHALSKIGGLRVVARTSAFAFKHKQVDVRIIGKQLNVDTVLEGSVRRAGNRIRVTAQLVNTEDGFELWSERFEHELDDVFAMQDEVVRAILRTARPTLVDKPIPTRPSSSSFEAYELYLRGRYHWNKRTEAGLSKSVEHLTQALELDPQFALAMAGLADSYTTLGIYGAAPPREVMPLAKSMAEQALAVEDMAEALSALACIRAVYDWDWAAAERDFERAIELNPQYPTAYQWYAVNCLAPMGRFAEARTRLGQAENLDPIAPVISLTKGLVSYLEGSFDRARDELAALLEMEQDFGMAHYFLGQVYVQEGRLDDAVSELETAMGLSGDTPEMTAALAHAHAVAGKRAKAEAMIKNLRDRSSERFVSPALIAQVYAGLGETDLAFDWLENGYVAKAPEMMWIGVRPVFQALAADPRMDDLRSRIGLQMSANSYR